MKNELIKINDVFPIVAERKIPKRTKELLYFSKDIPIKINTGISFSIRFNAHLNVDIEDLSIDFSLIKNSYQKLQLSIFDKIKKQINIEMDIVDNSIAEPSIIYLMLPVKKPKNLNEAYSCGYFPNYGLLTCEQRWVYLNWLTDIRQPVDKSYVKLYYLGLERQLCTSTNKDVIDEIILLAESHNFLKKTAYVALFFSYFYNNDIKTLQKIVSWNSEVPINNLKLIYYYFKKIALTSKDIFELINQYPDINKRYIKLYSQLYLQEIEKYLDEKYNRYDYAFYKDFSLSDLPKRFQYFLMNRSLPHEIRRVNIYDIIGCEKFKKTILQIHQNIHQSVKRKLKSLRMNKI